MPNDILWACIRHAIGRAHRVPEVIFAWQGGEPTLLGLDFFTKALELQKDCCRPGMVIRNTFQTSGVLFDDR